MAVIRLRTRRTGEDLRDVLLIKPRARARRSDNSSRVAMSRLAAVLAEKHNDGPDVLCGWSSLETVLEAARELLEGHRLRRGHLKLRRHVKTVERWMKEARSADEANRILPEWEAHDAR